MSKLDQFADLFSGATSVKKDDSKLSLSERQKLSKANVPLNYSNDNWANLNVFSKSGSSRSTPIESQTPVSQQNIDLFEGFDVLNNASNQSKAPQSLQQPTNQHLFEGFSNSTTHLPQSHQNSELDLLGEFTSNSSFSSISLNSKARSDSQHQPLQQLQPKTTSGQNLDDIFAAFDKPPQPIPQSNERHTRYHSNGEYRLPSSGSRTPQDKLGQQQQQQLHIPANNDALDEAIASFVDMGFSVEQASEALSHTSSGTDVEQAISYIMNKAHNSVKDKPSGLAPDRESYLSTTKTPEQYLQTFSTFLNKATVDITNRFFTPPPVNDGRPAWMKDRAKYKARATEKYEEDPDNLTIEELDKLSFKSELNSRSHRSSFQNGRRKESESSTPKAQKQSQRELPKEPEVNLFEPIPTKPRSAEPDSVDLLSLNAPSSTPSSNEQMRTSSRRRTNTAPVPTQIPSVSTTPKTARNFIPINPMQLELFEDSRKLGGTAFKNGDFTSALEHYQSALGTLPPNHILRIIAYSNLIAAYNKIGENRKVVETASEALRLIGPTRGSGEEIEKGKPMKDFWIKILQKKAEALEHLEKSKDSLECWNELIENGAANKISLEGKRRCQNVLNPKPKEIPKKPYRSQFSPAPSSASSNSKNTSAVKKLQESNKDSENFEEEKFRLKDQLDSRINQWKNGKEENIRALLSSLQNVLWESSNWKPVGMSELVMPKKVKIIYMKAVAKVHPDKISKDAPAEQKIIAESIFVVINHAWESFRASNGL